MFPWLTPWAIFSRPFGADVQESEERNVETPGAGETACPTKPPRRSSQNVAAARALAGPESLELPCLESRATLRGCSTANQQLTGQKLEVHGEKLQERVDNPLPVNNLPHHHRASPIRLSAGGRILKPKGTRPRSCNRVRS